MSLTLLLSILASLSAVLARPSLHNTSPYADVLQARQASPSYDNQTSSGPTVDLGYAIYQGVANATTNLNVFKG